MLGSSALDSCGYTAFGLWMSGTSALTMVVSVRAVSPQMTGYSVLDSGGMCYNSLELFQPLGPAVSLSSGTLCPSEFL
jgi:hypothetical protein